MIDDLPFITLDAYLNSPFHSVCSIHFGTNPESNYVIRRLSIRPSLDANGNGIERNKVME